jgi:ABC-type sugar transport system permease subunit
MAAEMVLGLGIALLLNIDLPGIRLCRNALIIPAMVTPIVCADVRSPISQDLAGQGRVGIFAP